MDRFLLFAIYFGHDSTALYGGTIELDPKPHDDPTALGSFHAGIYKPAEKSAISTVFPAYRIAFAAADHEFHVFILGRYADGDSFVGTMINRSLKTEPIPISLQRIGVDN